MSNDINNTIKGKKDVFLSYRSTHLDIAKRVFEELERHHINVWFDKDILHENIGERYLPIIQGGIDNSSIFLLLYSNDIVDSEFIIEHELVMPSEEEK